MTETIKLLEQGLSETQAEVVTLKTSNEEMTNKITDVCGEENLSDIKKTLAGNFYQFVPLTTVWVPLKYLSWR